MYLPELLASEPKSAVQQKVPAKSDSRESDAFTATFNQQQGDSNPSRNAEMTSPETARQTQESVGDTAKQADTPAVPETDNPTSTASVATAPDPKAKVAAAPVVLGSENNVLKRAAGTPESPLFTAPVVTDAGRAGPNVPPTTVLPTAQTGKSELAQPTPLTSSQGNPSTVLRQTPGQSSDLTVSLPATGSGNEQKPVQQSSAASLIPTVISNVDGKAPAPVESTTANAQARNADGAPSLNTAPTTPDVASKVAQQGPVLAAASTLQGQARDQARTSTPTAAVENQVRGDQISNPNQVEKLKNPPVVSFEKPVDLSTLAAKVATRSQGTGAQSLVNPTTFGDAPTILGGTTEIANTQMSQMRTVALAGQDSAVIARQAAPQIANAIAARPHGGTIDIRLDPPELGRVEIVLDLSEQGVRAVLSAERASTGDLLRRHAELLMQQLEDSGFENIDLSFGQEHAGQRDGDSGSQSELPTSTVDAEPTRPAPGRVSVIGQSQVDIVL